MSIKAFVLVAVAAAAIICGAVAAHHHGYAGGLHDLLAAIHGRREPNGNDCHEDTKTRRRKRKDQNTKNIYHGSNGGTSSDDTGTCDGRPERPACDEAKAR